MENEFVLELPTDVQSIEHAVEFVLDRCEHCREEVHVPRMNFRVGLTEAIANAMLYGNDHDPRKRVRVEVCMARGQLRVRVSDEGGGFDPALVPDPTRPENLEKECGRGLFLMRQLLDEVSFNDRGNEVTLVLRLDEGTALGGGAPA